MTPGVDIEETDDAYVVEVVLPGLAREDIQVNAAGQELSIIAEYSDRPCHGVIRQRGWRTGSVVWRATLPGGVDVDAAEARYADGILTVRLPRTEASKPRRKNSVGGRGTGLGSYGVTAVSTTTGSVRPVFACHFAKCGARAAIRVARDARESAPAACLARVHRRSH